MSNVKVYASTEYVKAAVQEYNDIPMVFLTGTLPTTKDNVVMGFDYISKQYNKSGWCEIKCQGTSSMGYPKKNFTIKAYEDEALTQKIKFDFRGWGEQSKFCYKANWIDITHSRNVLSARLWGEVVKTRANYDSIPEELRTAPNQGAIDGFMVKVYVNGVFYGRYTLNIPKDAWMSNMDESNNNQSILVGEDCANSGVFLAPALIDGNDWSDELHEVVPENVKTRWNEAISFINDATDEDFKNNIGNYFDVESLIDYDIFGTVICGIDSFGKNQIYFSYDNQKWYASMYDLDSTFGLMWDGSVLLPPNHARGKFQDSRRNLLYNRLEKAFGPQIAARYNELSKTVLSVPHICAIFEEFISAQPFDLREEDKIFTDVDGNEHNLPLADTNTLRQIQKFAAARKSYND